VSWPGPAGVAETHSAWVFFAGDRACKLKKPVDLGFLDFRSREVRAAVCAREVELNRRLAPDVYLGVADVHGPDGQVCDHLVLMRRMPPDRRLSALVAAGDPHLDDHLWQLAHLLAAFHARAERGPAADEAATVEARAALWEANTASLREAADQGVVDAGEVDRVQALADRYLAGRRPLFDRRIAEGRACDGHGDLLADDIFCLEDGPRVLDCIEFDDRLRYGDVLGDVAFLAMDLEHLGHPEAAARFLAAYREHADDAWPASLAHHHIAYRAQVRAKVAAIRAVQGAAASVEQARALLTQARRHLEAARVRLILVGGLPGTGKSTLAAGLGDTLAATVLRSDEVRKELAGLRADATATAPYGHGIYTPAHTRATYETLLGRAGTALAHGETVVLDASWIDAAWRTRARELAHRHHADLTELRCELTPDAADRRMRARAATGADPSDATPAIAHALRARTHPWPSATTVDTSGDAAATLATALRHVGWHAAEPGRPAGEELADRPPPP
jgi:aminoglycoside phosphotransferase family enzyme/predicted kinase